MPTYVYQCSHCGKVAEVYQPYDVEQRTEPECQECHDDMRRVWQPTHVHFKGAGFYYTDKDNKQA